MKRKTIFCDIDGTLLVQPEDFTTMVTSPDAMPLPCASKRLMEWHYEGALIILTTGRPESMRPITELQLHNAGMIYNTLLMGLGTGERILINDFVPGEGHKAIAYNVVRNTEGLENIV